MIMTDSLRWPDSVRVDQQTHATAIRLNWPAIAASPGLF